MFGHLSPENLAANPIRNERGNTTRTLLLLLLLVVAAAGYLYYFTDLIRPKETAKPAPVQTAQVKKPLPPRPGQEAGPAKPEAAKPSEGATPAAATPGATKPAGENKPAPAAVPPAKPEPVKIAKAEPPVKQAPAAATEPAKAPAKPAPAPVKKEAAPGQAAKKEAVPAKKESAPTKKAVKSANSAVKAEKTVAKAERPAVKVKRGGYALLVGDFVPDPTFLAVQAKLKKCGIAPVRKSVLTAPEPMNRLFVAAFTDQDTAEAELQKLKQFTADAFLIADNGTYTLYAGSYFTEGRTASEMKRLNAKGVTPVIKKARLTIKVTRVTAGSYASPEEARKDALRLKKQGVSATVIKTK
ncbi:MAG TPA: SPOR domain-containing protein [Geobacteraceae bacterium]